MLSMWRESLLQQSTAQCGGCTPCLAGPAATAVSLTVAERAVCNHPQTQPDPGMAAEAVAAGLSANFPGLTLSTGMED